MTRRRIAVIEDESAIASSLAARLTSEGFDVEVAGDGVAGVELCRRFRPDLVVLDLMLPGLDGLEVCQPGLSPRDRRDADRDSRASRRSSLGGPGPAPASAGARW